MQTHFTRLALLRGALQTMLLGQVHWHGVTVDNRYPDPFAGVAVAVDRLARIIHE